MFPDGLEAHKTVLCDAKVVLDDLRIVPSFQPADVGSSDKVIRFRDVNTAHTTSESFSIR